VFALAEAVRRATPERMTQIAENAVWLRHELRTRGFALVAPESVASPAIVTLVLDEGMSAAELGEELEIRGYWLNYRSNYLMEKNWIQPASSAIRSGPASKNCSMFSAPFVPATASRSADRRTRQNAELKTSERQPP